MRRQRRGPPVAAGLLLGAGLTFAQRPRQAGKAAQETNMNLFLWCVTGALIALLASFRAATLGRQRLLVEVAFSGVGAVAGGMLATPSGHWLSFETHWQGIAAAIVGAVMLLGVANFRVMRSHMP